MNLWKTTINAAGLATINAEETHSTMRLLCASLGYPRYVIGSEVWQVVPDAEGKPTSTLTELVLDDAGDFETYFLVKDGRPLMGPSGPVAFVDPCEARKAAIQFGGAVKSFSDIRKAHEASRVIVTKQQDTTPGGLILKP